MIKGVIFDMDGVLVDNSQAHIDSFVIFCERHGVQITAQELKPLFGLSNDEIMPKVMGRDLTPEETAQLAAEKEAIYREMFEAIIEPAPGLVDTLKELSRRGIKIAVGSSGPKENVDFVLEKCGIASYFSAKISGDMVSRAKPDPEVFLKAAEALGLKPEECMVFEDSFAGIEAADRAGMDVVVLATTFPRELHDKSRFIIDNFKQYVL